MYEQVYGNKFLGLAKSHLIWPIFIELVFSLLIFFFLLSYTALKGQTRVSHFTYVRNSQLWLRISMKLIFSRYTPIALFKFLIVSSKVNNSDTKLLFQTGIRETLCHHVNQIKHLFSLKFFSKFHALLCWGIHANQWGSFLFMRKLFEQCLQ